MKNMIQDVQVWNTSLSTTNNQVAANTSWLGKTLTATLLLLTLGVGQMWANDAYNARIYYDNTTSQWTYVQLLGGHSTWSSGTALSLISGTNNLWTNTWSWGGYTYFMFIDASGSWEGLEQEAWSRKGGASHYSKTFSTNVSSNTYLYTSTSTSNNTGPTETIISGYSALNYTQTVYKYVSENGGTPAASTANIATISIATKYLSSANATGDHNVSIGSGNSSANTTAARTATVTLTATSIADGYTFLGWYSAGTGGTLLESSTTYSYQATATKSVYARFSHETTHSVTITYTCASPSATVSTATNQAIGQVTASSITAPTVTGYTFNNWTIGSGISNQSASTSANPISVKTLSSGDYTLQANYTEDLTSPWTIKGGTGLTGNNWSTAYNMTKKTGHSTESVAYYTFNISATNTGDDQVNAYGFKLLKSSEYYGASADGDSYWVNATASNIPINTSGDNLQIRANVAGPYEVKVDYSTPASPKVTVTFPTSYTLTYSIGSVAGTSGSISTSPSTASGSKVLSGNTVTLTAPTEKTGYSWKGWYTAANGSGTQQCATKAYAVTMNANKTLYACYTENTFNVKATASPAAGGTVSPTSNTAMGQATGGDIKATPADGYSFSGWTIASGSGYFGTTGTSTTSATANTKFRPTAASTLTGSFSEVMRTVSVGVNNAAFGTVSSVSLTNVGPATASAAVTATPAAGATFTGWTLPSGVTAATSYTISSNPIKVNATAASKTITANFTETTYSVTLTNANSSQGTVNTSSPVSVGQITAVQIQATAKTNYMFDGWVKTGGSGTVTYYTGAGTGQVVDAGGASKATTYICVTGDVTLQATWAEDRSSGYVVLYGNDGKDADGNNNAGMTRAWQEGPLYKPAGSPSSTTSSFVFTASVADVDKVIEFKIKQLSPVIHYGYKSASGGKIDANISNVALNTTYGNGRLCITMPGDYTFTWNTTGNKLTIAYPTSVYYVRGGFNSWGWTHPMTLESANTYSATINITQADHNYSGDSGFKLLIGGSYYGKNSTTVSSTSNTVASCSTSGGNIGLATTVSGNYKFSYNTSTNTLTVTYPTIPAMTGSLSLTATGADGGSGTESDPYLVYPNGTLSLTATHTSAPATDSHFKYTFYQGETAKQTKASNAANCTTYSHSVGSTTGATKYQLKVSAYNEYGPSGYTAKGTAVTSGIIYYKVVPEPTITLTASPTTLNDGSNVTLTATAGNLISGKSYTIVIKETNASGTQLKTSGSVNATAASHNLTHTYAPTYSASRTYYAAVTFLGRMVSTTVNITMRKVPVLTTTTASSVADMSAVLGGNVTNYGNSTMTDYGIYYSTSSTLSSANAASIGTKVQIGNNKSSTGEFTKTVTGLDAATTYYFIAYATNAAGTGWGATKNFTTSSAGNRIVIRAHIDESIFTDDIHNNGDNDKWKEVNLHYWNTNNSKDLTIESNSAAANGTWVNEGNRWYEFILPAGITKADIQFYSNELGHGHTGIKTVDITDVQESGCYLILPDRDGELKRKVKVTEDCALYYRVKTKYNETINFYSNRVYKSNQDMSFFISHTAKQLKLQHHNGVEWIDIKDITSYAPTPASNATHIYTAHFKGATATQPVDDYSAYTGDYFIRSDIAPGGWSEYTNAGNKMTYFNDASSTYNHYWVAYTGDGVNKNIDAEVGNAINPSLSRTLQDRGVLADGYGYVREKNVRYSYDNRVGYLDYAVISGSTSENFLTTYGADATPSTKVFKLTGTATSESNATDQVTFEDLSDWRYQADVLTKATANSEVTIGVIARLADKSAQDLVPKERPLVALGNTTTPGSYIIRIIYDFKQNTIVTGWLPKANETIGSNTTIQGNMILNRVEGGSVPQITITNDSYKLTGLQKLYMALEIQRDNASGEYQKVRKAGSNTPIISNATETDKNTNLYYWISLPYACRVSEIFGLQGTYGYKWGLFRYRGDRRAQNGLFIDSGTYWEFVGEDEVLTPYEGYALAIDLHWSDFNQITINDVTRSSKYIYFPTMQDGYTLENKTTSTNLVDYTCTIKGREEYDTGWHIIGVPGYHDINISSTTSPAFAIADKIPAFYYEYVYNNHGAPGSSDNNAYTYHITTGDEYKAFHGYLVQYNGTINWQKAADNTKTSIRRRANSNKTNYFESATLELLLSTDDIEQDNTFVQLQDEATEDFDYNLDLAKMKTSKVPNLYTLGSKGEELAANCLPIDTRVIDLGLMLPVTADYTFSLRNTELPTGLQAILYDTETRQEIDLSQDDYTVTLAKGTHNGRLQLRLSVSTVDIGTDIRNNAGTGNLTATVVDGKLLLSGLGDEGADLRIYDPAGRLVYEGHAARGYSIPLPAVAGVYLVNAGNQVIKVVK